MLGGRSKLVGEMGSSLILQVYMPSLRNAARHVFHEYGMEFIWLNNGHDGMETMFPDPIIAAADSDTFETLHILMCADTGADPAYISARRVVDWLTEGYTAQKTRAAHA